MPVASNIVLNDGAATPVATTFSPIGRDSKGVIWYEQTNPAPVVPKLGARKLAIRITRSSVSTGSARGTASDTAKVVFSMYAPYMSQSGNTASGYVAVPKVEYALDFRLEYTMSERSSTGERKDLRAFTSSLMGNSVASDLIDLLNPIYGA